MESCSVQLTDGEIVDLYFAIDQYISGAEEMAEHWASYHDADAQHQCLRAIDRLHAIKAKLTSAQNTIRGTLY